MAMHYFHMANGHTRFDKDGTDLSDLPSVARKPFGLPATC
jgi:hypothetical protein